MARRVQAGFAWVPSRPAFVRHLHVSPPRWNPPERDEVLFVREDTPYLGSTTFSLVMGQELLVEATPAFEALPCACALEMRSLRFDFAPYEGRVMHLFASEPGVLADVPKIEESVGGSAGLLLDALLVRLGGLIAARASNRELRRLVERAWVLGRDVAACVAAEVDLSLVEPWEEAT